MTHRLLTLPLAAVAIVGLCACQSQNSGNPVATNTTSSAPTGGGSPSGGTSTSSGDPLASVDPCSLITQQTITSNQLQPGQVDNNAGGTRACRWTKPDDGTTVDGYLIEVAIYDSVGVDHFSEPGGTSDFSVGKYKGKLGKDPQLSSCVVSLGTSSTSRVDILVNSSLGIDQSCKLVQQVAPKVTPQFPAGS